MPVMKGLGFGGVRQIKEKRLNLLNYFAQISETVLNIQFQYITALFWKTTELQIWLYLNLTTHDVFFLLLSLDNPKFPKEKLNPVEVDEGQPFILKCDPPKGIPPLQIYWMTISK